MEGSLGPFQFVVLMGLFRHVCRLLHVAPVWQRFAFPLQQGYLFEGVAINDGILVTSLYNVSEQQADSCDVKERL